MGQKLKQINIELPPKLLPLFQPKRYKIIYGGRGSAKSWSVARALIALAATKKMFVLCARETQTSIEQSVHKLLKEQIDLMQLTDFFTVQERKIIAKNGSEFVFAGIRQQGISNLKSLEGADICWIEEAQVVTKKSWSTLLPTIRKEDSEIWVTFNPELESDEVYRRFITNGSESAWVQQINYTDNKWFSRALEIERLECLRVTPDDYDCIWGGKCRPAVAGAIYLQEISKTEEESRIRNVPADPVLPVHTVWDLGWNDSTAITCFQVLHSEVRIVKYIEGSKRTLADYVADLEALDYRWGTDYLPHDGAARDFKTGKSAQELLEAMRRKVEIVPLAKVEEGIQAARMMFPRVYFDRDNAADLVTCLKRYTRNYNNKTEQYEKPLHDQYSHGADTFRYLATIIDTVDNDSRVSYTRTQAVNWQAV